MKALFAVALLIVSTAAMAGGGTKTLSSAVAKPPQGDSLGDKDARVAIICGGYSTPSMNILYNEEGNPEGATLECKEEQEQ